MQGEGRKGDAGGGGEVVVMVVLTATGRGMLGLALFGLFTTKAEQEPGEC